MRKFIVLTAVLNELLSYLAWSRHNLTMSRMTMTPPLVHRYKNEAMLLLFAKYLLLNWKPAIYMHIFWKEAKKLFQDLFELGRISSIQAWIAYNQLHYCRKSVLISSMAHVYNCRWHLPTMVIIVMWFTMSNIIYFWLNHTTFDIQRNWNGIQFNWKFNNQDISSRKSILRRKVPIWRNLKNQKPPQCLTVQFMTFTRDDGILSKMEGIRTEMNGAKMAFEMHSNEAST